VQLGEPAPGRNFSSSPCFTFLMMKFSVRGRRGSALVARRARPAIMGPIRMTSSSYFWLSIDAKEPSGMTYQDRDGSEHAGR
jgi:hypothetical protein